MPWNKTSILTDVMRRFGNSQSLIDSVLKCWSNETSYFPTIIFDKTLKCTSLEGREIERRAYYFAGVVCDQNTQKVYLVLKVRYRSGPSHTVLLDIDSPFYGELGRHAQGIKQNLGEEVRALVKQNAIQKVYTIKTDKAIW